jgi:hypothetical protein
VDRSKEVCTYIAETYVEAFELTAKDYDTIMAMESVQPGTLRIGLHRVAENPPL